MSASALPEGVTTAQDLKAHYAAVRARLYKREPEVPLAPLPEPGGHDLAVQRLVERYREVQIRFTPTRQTAIRRIIAATAREHRLTSADITGASRSHPVVLARHEAMYRVVASDDCKGLSLPTIGRAFRRDHTTVIHGVAQHCRRNGLELPAGKKWKSKVPEAVR